MPIVAKEFVNELHDHRQDDYGRWGFFKLRNYPIIIPDGTDLGQPFDEVTNPSPVKIKFQYPTMTDAVVIKDEWVVIPEEGAGQIQIVPGQGGLADVLLIPGALLPLWSGATGRVPGVWRFTYKAGFCPENLPEDIRAMIGMQASIGVLNIAGDLVIGAGIANISVGVPGLNQTIGTTASAENSAYSARIIQYRKAIDKQLPLLKQKYGKQSPSKLVVV